MGGRGSRSASGGASLQKMSYSQLGSELKRVDSRMGELGKTMERKAAGHMAFVNEMPGASAADSRAYRSAQREYQKLQGDRAKIIDEMAKKRPKEKARPKTFVNGFGEATDREITSASYKRWLKRNEREIMSRMKGWR